MRNVLSVILGGGKGTRLFPLTRYRSKPAVPLAGKYRLIDIPISNCMNSGINRMYLLTQFNSVSLHRHIRQTYNFDNFSGGFVEILAAQQTNNRGTDWYQGTADAVRKQLRYFDQPGIDYILILSGDQLYRMNYADMLKTCQDADADVSIAVLPVASEEAHAFGIMKLDPSFRVVDFVEKPKTPEALADARTDPAKIDELGFESRGRDCLANMGIYLFKKDVLFELLEGNDYEDFGKQIFPLALKEKKVQAHLFDGYWEDIGTVKAFYEANLALAQPKPPFRFVAGNEPIYTHARFLPPTQISGATINNSMIADGCEIGEGTVIENSVVGLRCRIGRNAVIKDSILMGADFYEYGGAYGASEMQSENIGSGSHVEGAIIDKNCRIGRNVTIKPGPDMSDNEDFTEPVVVRDGVIFVQKEAQLPEGYVFRPH
ncbi:glucose-1-phosphate adenylyltransferase [Thalassoroseus pseudoceratinae]|uniref:glucose-1-phosphate adenylyltransferase n=1 Tax=Thalassoroseus pseudoceratinae TaxID=2713176 RepID=UPI00142161F2|nr:glucose-1-phosphate adenylyltransferase [Thalassoroseus pseudoceratinae]